MIEWTDLPLLGGVALFSAFLGSVAGSGGSTVLLPVLVLYFGIRDAVFIITIANLAANLSRVVFNRQEIVFPVVGWFVLGSFPASIAGAWLFTVTPPEVMTRGLGVLLISLVLWRRIRPSPKVGFPVRRFVVLGGAFGLLEGVLGSVGPLMAPFFLAFGLMRGAYIGTDALATVSMQGTKLAVFGSASLMREDIVVAGLVLVPFMIAGTLLGKRLLERVSDRFFALLVEAMLILAGLNFLIRA